jgi:hypothetical protein
VPATPLNVAPNLILTKNIEKEIITHVGLEGWFTVELIDAKTKRVKRKLRFKNTITDAGMNGIGNGTSIGTLLTSLAVGTGSTAPAVGQTSLVSEIDRTNSTGGTSDVYNSGSGFAYWYGQRVRLFVEAEANGNLTELGFFSSTTDLSGTMFNRQLFKDDLGNAVTITKTSGEQLKVTFEWRVYMDQSANAQTISISGVSTDLSHRAYDVDSSSAWGSTFLQNFGVFTGGNSVGYAWESQTMPSTTALQTGSPVLASSSTVQAYTNGNFYRDIEYKWEPAVANFTLGIGTITTGVIGSSSANLSFITTFNPRVAKDNTKRFTIINRYSWARH